MSSCKPQSVWLFVILAGLVFIESSGHSTPLGSHALQITEKILADGPRPSGSEALRSVQEFVIRHLAKSDIETAKKTFRANTPAGPINMTNLVATITGQGNRILMVACHLESKKFADFRFVGANDAASACALLLAMAPGLKSKGLRHTIWLVFFDGEEAIEKWTSEDSLYGSRQLAKEIKEAGLKDSITAMILLDMIGDKDLTVARELNSDPRLVEQLNTIVERNEWQPYFFRYSTAIQDDHLPFKKIGIPTIDIIDFRYGPAAPTQLRHLHPAGLYFHSAADTIDKLSAKSLEIVGKAVIQLIEDIDQNGINNGT